MFAISVAAAASVAVESMRLSRQSGKSFQRSLKCSIKSCSNKSAPVLHK